MVADLYNASFAVGTAVAIVAMIHYAVASWRRGPREARELAEALKARERGEVVPLPEFGPFLRGTIPGAAGAAFVADGIVCLVSGQFEVGDVVRRAAYATLIACGIQYVVTSLRRDKTPGVWPNAPWLAWLVAAVLGLLGGLAEAASPGPMR